MNNFSRAYMPNIICGKGSISFVNTLGKKRAAVLGYNDSVKALAEKIFEGTDTEIRYIATIEHEPLIKDLFDNLPTMNEFQPDLILAIGGGSVMDVAKGLHLFYENPEMSFEDSLKPFQLPVLGKKLKGYDHPDALLTGVETRSSSPVRLVRDDRYEANIRGIYPCGEGAGYAGGILSAAADGMRCAEKLLEVCK